MHAALLAVVIATAAAARAAEAQATAATPLGVLLAEARLANPEIAAARELAAAARARIPQAGALPDPVLSAGMMYVPIPRFDLTADGMTMGTIQVGQRLPPPGSLGIRESIARQTHSAALWHAEEVELDVLTRLKEAYYETIFLDHALEVLARNRALLIDFAEVARGRFAVGRAPQQDVLRAQTEITRLEEQIAGLRARRTAAAAKVNAVLQRPAVEPLTPIYPHSVRAVALGAPAAGAFMAAALGGGMGAGFPTLEELQRQALEQRPVLKAHVHRIAAAHAQLRLAERERLPEIDVMLGYGVRGSRPDMMSATVSVPLPVFAARKQRQVVLEARHERTASELQHHQMVADIGAEIATHYAALVRTREQIVLLGEGVIPQARATIEGAAAAYQSGRVEFASLLDAQSTLFRNEIELARQLSDFGRTLAALERAVGGVLITEETS